MLKRDQRLRKTKEIEAVFASGRSAYLGAIGIKVAKNSLDIPRFTVLVNKKVSKKAVLRNKLKRRIREILKKQLVNLAPHDFVIICQPAALSLELPELRQNLQGLLVKLRMLL